MDILFKSGKLQKECNNQQTLVKRYGQQRAKLLRRRLDDLGSVETLADLRKLPATRSHELKNNRKGQLAVDLDQPYRLIFEPAHEEVPLKEDGGLDWEKVTAVRILEIVDYHD